MRSGLGLPLFDELADPALLARLAAEAEEAGWHGVFLWVGLGGARFAHEFSTTGEETDDRRRGRMLDEAIGILIAAWSGEPVHHHGEHYTVDGMRFLPRPVQQPGVPVWVAGFLGNAKPMRRAARHQGFVPV